MALFQFMLVSCFYFFTAVSQEAGYDFTTLPPWYRAWWANFIYLLVAGGLVVVLVRLRTRHLAARLRQVKKTVEERTAETLQKVNELAIINSVQQGLASKLDMQAIYDLIGDKIRDIFDAQVVDIGIHDRNANLLRFPYTIERGVRFLDEPMQLIGYRRHVMHTRQPLMINENIQEENAKYGNPAVISGEPPRSVLFVPLVVGEEVRGVISLQNLDRENAFTDSDLRLLQTLANSMSVALENARLFDETNRLLKETEQRNAELAVINSVQEGLVAQMDMQGIYNLVGDKVRDIFDAQAVIISIFDQDAGLERFQYMFEKGERYYPEPRPITSVRSHLIRTRQMVLINKDFAQDYAKFGGGGAIPGTELPKSAVWLPLVVGETVKGYVSLQNIDREMAFSDSDVRLLITLANSMSVALENARLFDETNRLLKETRERAAELAIINRVGEGLAQQLDFQAIIDLVGDKICEVFKAQVVTISLFEPKTKQIHHRYMIELGQRYYFEKPQPIDPDRQEIIETHKPLVFATSQEMIDRSGEGVIAGEMPKSYMGVPIILGQEPTGVITVQDLDREHHFTESDLRLLSTLAANMGVALENARLFDETKRLLKETEQRNAELAVINGVQDGLVRELEMQAIYDLVGDRICELFDTQTVLIRSFDHDHGLEHWHYAREEGKRLHVEPRPFIWANRQLIKTGQALLINENYVETAHKFGGKGVTVGKPPKSAVFVPMIVGDTVRGSVSLQNIEREHAFSDAVVRLLTTLANSMSVALENARLFTAANQRAIELTTVNEISRALVSQLEFDALIHLVGEHMRETFNADIVYVALLNKETNMITFPYGYGDEYPPMPFGEGLTSEIIVSGKPLLINEDIRGRFEGVGRRSASYLGVPVSIGEEVRGVISVQSTQQSNRFDDNDTRLLTTIAANVGVALQNAEAYRKLNETLENLKATQDQLVTQEKLASLGALTAGIAHEIKNPLNFVNNFAELSVELISELRQLLEKQRGSVEKPVAENITEILHDLEKNATKINEHGKRADSIVKSMLQHSRGKKGERQETDINAMLEEDVNLAYHGMRAQDTSFNISIEKNFDKNLGRISVVPQDISRVFLNIISNGFYAAHLKTREGEMVRGRAEDTQLPTHPLSHSPTHKFRPTLCVSTKNLGDKIEIRIRDNGNGIPDEIRDKLFQPFFTTKPTGSGTGLGLSISYDIIVQQHGGNITFESKEQEFTEFIISLPKAKNGVQAGINQK